MCVCGEYGKEVGRQGDVILKPRSDKKENCTHLRWTPPSSMVLWVVKLISLGNGGREEIVSYTLASKK